MLIFKPRFQDPKDDQRHRERGIIECEADLEDEILWLCFFYFVDSFFFFFALTCIDILNHYAA